MPILGRVLLATGIGMACAAFVVTSHDFGRPEWRERDELRPPVSYELPLGDPHRTEFLICSGSGRANCVVDGDTFWFAAIKIRIADIDAPEISEPACNGERQAGEMAKGRLVDLLNAGAFTLITGERDEDRYGRKLRIVARDGFSLGEILVRESLARRWDEPLLDWCS